MHTLSLLPYSIQICHLSWPKQVLIAY